MDFNNIVGHKKIITSLEHILQNDKIGHAYIFTGPKGVGKKTIVNAFLANLLCHKSLEGRSCKECMACSLLDKRTNPDYYIIDPKGQNIGIEEIRHIQADIYIKPLYSRRKVYIISEADKMTIQAQNCLLKILEEPPNYVVIILTASNYDAILETVRSRTVRYSVERNTYEEVKYYLENVLDKEVKNIDFIIGYSDGVIGNAMNLIKSEELYKLREDVISIVL